MLEITNLHATVDGISQHVANVRGTVGNIALTIDQMNAEVQVMSQQMHHMAKPARTINKMFPFP